MTTITQAKEAMLLAFTAAWGSTTPVFLDNEEAEPPVGSSWVRVAVRHNAASQETLGGAPYRRFSRGGSLFIQVFAPQNAGGTQVADALAEQARDIFEGITLASGSIRFIDVVVREIGPSEGYYQVNVEAEFEYDEQK